MENGQFLRKTLTAHWWDIDPLEAKIYLTIYWFADPDSKEAIFSCFSLSQKVNSKTKEILPHLEKLKIRGLIEFIPGKNFFLDSRFRILSKNTELEPIPNRIDIVSNPDNDPKNLKTVNDIESKRRTEKQESFQEASDSLTASFLANQFDDAENLALYEAYLERYSQTIIRRAYQTVSQTPQNRIKKSPGAYFNYLVKKYANDQ